MAGSQSTRFVGYARVSTREQETDLQLDALRSAGVTDVFQEKASSVGHRPELERCLDSLAAGDMPRLRLLLILAPIWFEPEKAKPRP